MHVCPPVRVTIPVNRYRSTQFRHWQALTSIFLIQSFLLVHPGIPRCRLRGLLWSVFTIRSSTRVQVNIYAHFVPCTRLIILGNELLIGSNTSYTDPLFRHLSRTIAFSICAQLTNVRPTRSLLAISSLLNPHYGFSGRSPDLAGNVHYSGARGIPFTASLPHPSCMSLATIIRLYILFSTGPLRDAMHTFTLLRGSCIHVVRSGPGLGIRKLIPSCSSALG